MALIDPDARAALERGRENLARITALLRAYNDGTGPCRCGERRGHIGWMNCAMKALELTDD